MKQFCSLFNQIKGWSQLFCNSK